MPEATRASAATASPPLWGLVAVALALGGSVGWGAMALLPGGAPPVEDAAVAGEAPAVEGGPGAEAVPADDVATRLRLANRHFDASEYDLALEHYLGILEHQPGNVRALARAGWIAYEGGDDALASRLLDRALAVQPDDPETQWFLGNVRLHGLRDAAAARAVLEPLAARDDLGEAFAAAVDALLVEAGGSTPAPRP